MIAADIVHGFVEDVPTGNHRFISHEIWDVPVNCPLTQPIESPGLRDRWWVAPSCRADHSRCAAVISYAGWGLYIMTLGHGEVLNREI